MTKAGNDPYSTAILQKSPPTLECHYDTLGTKSMCDSPLISPLFAKPWAVQNFKVFVSSVQSLASRVRASESRV